MFKISLQFSIIMSFRKIDPVKLRERREQLGFTLRDVAQKANNAFSYSTVGGWENNGWQPGHENTLILLEVLECDYDDISSPVVSSSAAAPSAPPPGDNLPAQTG